MHTKRIFQLELAGFVLVLLSYGLIRQRLGIDLTDEGAYLAWPLRVALGEAPFSSELLTLIRPIEVYLSILFKVHPGLTLYEFRMLGWLIHLLSFTLFSCCLFRLSDAPLLSLLIACVPVFACQIFGLVAPSYNTLSGDFLLAALSLWAIAGMDPQRRRLVGFASGAAFFLATLAHPGLGLVTAILLGHEVLRGSLWQNLRRRDLTTTNLGAVVFLGCWLLFLGYFWGSGALAAWHARMGFSRSVVTFGQSFLQFLFQLLTYPFNHSETAFDCGSIALLAAGLTCLLTRFGTERIAGASRILLGLILVSTLAYTLRVESAYLPIAFAMASLVIAAMPFISPLSSALTPCPPIRLLILLSGCAALVYASLTYYFSPYRSWVSGIQGLPFAFGAGLTLLLDVRPRQFALLKAFLPIMLACVVYWAASENYRYVYRDDRIEALTTEFRIPKLRHIRSTAERVRVLEELYGYLNGRISFGEPLLAFDSIPMLYFILDARPAYGLAWAVRYGQSPVVLAKLNAELMAKPLPTYAIRNLIDVAPGVWSTAPKISYENYPLNETVMANYVLEKTVYPFEIWRLKTAGP